MILRRQRREYRPHRAVFACVGCGDSMRFFGIDCRHLAVLCGQCAWTYSVATTYGQTTGAVVA